MSDRLQSDVATAMRVTLFVLVAMLAGRSAGAVTINWESLPTLPQQPASFAAAGPMQTFSSPDLFTVSGGVTLGNPNFLAAFAAHGSAPNAYGTSDFGDPSLLDTITLAFPATSFVTGVSGVLFNGQAFPEVYTLTFFSPTNSVLATQTAAAVLPTSNPLDFFNFGFSSAAPIGRVTITTPNAVANGWDFFVDSVNLTQTSPVPEPATVVLLATGVLGWRFRRRP
jgi:hypothetical protein